MEAEIAARIEEAIGFGGIVDATFARLIKTRLGKIHVQKRYRIKTQKSLLEKILSRQSEPDGKSYSVQDVKDVVGFRFVCHFQRDVEEVVLALMESVYDQETREFDSIHEATIYTTNAPNQTLFADRIKESLSKKVSQVTVDKKSSAYTSVHLIVSRKRDIFEVQIRNVFEDAWAEIEHALKYKAPKGNLSPAVVRHLVGLNAYMQASMFYSELILQDSIDSAEQANKAEVRVLKDDADEVSQLPQSVQKLVKSLESLRSEKNWAAVFSKLEAFSEQNPEILKRPNVLYYVDMEMGILDIKLKRPLEAVARYENLRKLFPDRAIIYSRIADAYRVMGDFQTAIDYLLPISTKLASPSNTKKELEFLRVHPFTLAHSYWRIDKPRLSYETLKEAEKSGLIPYEGKELTFLNCTAYYLLDMARVEKNEVATDVLADLYQSFLKFSVKSGMFWSQLDTFMLICDLLGYSQEVVECANLLESMIVYEGDVPTIILASGELHSIASIAEIEVVRGHCNRLKRKHLAILKSS
jgi:ppGpp synthetase/RelA/SpoT-type nucleotidyltranferase